MNNIIKIFLICSLFFQFSFAISSKYYQDKFATSKKLYLGAVMSSNKSKEIEYLKKLVRYGDKLKINTLKYKRELNRLDKNVIIKNPVKTKSILKHKYTIKSVKKYQNSIVINFNRKINKSYIKFYEKKTKYRHYDYFDLKGSFKNAKSIKLSMNNVNRIKIIQHKKNILRISLENKTNLKTVYIVNKNQIIIKVLETRKKSRKVTKQKAVKQKVKLLPANIFYPSKKIIVIDAGHGGRDAGAVGTKRIYEKNVVLKVSKYLKTELVKKGFTVYLTRYKDRYVKLSKRTKLANSKKADLFISIHANAARKSRARKAYGIETYFLSPARSKRAKRVAALENKGDMKKMGWSSKNSLLTVLNQSKITASNKMAIDIQRNMLFNLRNKYGKKAIRDGGVREGPFWVLVGAQMPSVLVEVGYISHPIEGVRINTRRYQKLIAHGIANGIERYFINN